MKNKILLTAGIILALAVIIVIIILAGSGRFFQGALYNLRPIYTSCQIEGKDFNSKNLDDCEHFYEKFQKNLFPDGEYTIIAKYTDKKLPENIIPIRIKDRELSCTYKESGFLPVVNIITPNDQLSSETVKSTDVIPVGSEGLIARINYSKNNQVYAYDVNICEAAFQATVYDTNKVELGTAKLDTNGFINSRPSINEVLITNELYYSGKGGTTIKQFTPGNVYAILNAAPDLTFKFTIDCSSNFPKVTIPSVTTDSNTTLLFQGLNEQFFQTCGSKLYLSFQNANRADDIQPFNPIKLTPVDKNSVKYDLKLADLVSINLKDTKFPFIYSVKLHLRERSDVNEVQTLGTGVLTISKYTPIDYNKLTTGPTTTGASTQTTTGPTPAPTPDITKDIIPPPSQSSESVTARPKVRRSAEPILIRPAIETTSPPPLPPESPIAAYLGPIGEPIDQP